MDFPQNKLFSSFGNLQVTLVGGIDLLDGWPVSEISNSLFFKCSILNEDCESILSFSTDSDIYVGGEYDLYHQIYLFENVRSTFTLSISVNSYRIWPLISSTGQPPYTEIKIGELLIPISRLAIGINVISWHQLSSEAKECSKASVKLGVKYIQEGLVVHDINRTKLSKQNNTNVNKDNSPPANSNIKIIHTYIHIYIYMI